MPEENKSYKDAMTILEGMEFEGKDSVLGGLRDHNQSKSNESKTIREEFQTYRTSQDEINKKTQDMLASFGDMTNNVTGKQIDTSVLDSATIDTITNDFRSMKDEFAGIKAERETELKNSQDLKKGNAIEQAMIDANLTVSAIEDFKEVIALKSEYNSENELVVEGVRLSDYVNKKFEGKDQFKKNTVLGGAGVAGATGGDTNKTLADRAWEAQQR